MANPDIEAKQAELDALKAQAADEEANQPPDLSPESFHERISELERRIFGGAKE